MKTLKIPPNTISFKLISVQQFPRNQRVALYFCQDLKKYFSMTYGKDGIELSESEFSIIEKLKSLKDIEPFYFHDGSTLNIDNQCASKIIELYDTISEGKSEFEEYLLESDSNFLKVLDFAANK